MFHAKYNQVSYKCIVELYTKNKILCTMMQKIQKKL